MQQDTRLSKKKKSEVLLYTDDKRAGEEIRGAIPFTIASNSIKYLGVTLNKLVEGLYDKNFKSLMKEIEETHVFKYIKKEAIILIRHLLTTHQGKICHGILKIFCN